MLVRIEQRLQDQARFLVLPADEAVLLGLPIMMGLLGRTIFTGVIIGVVAWTIWRRVKGEGGLEGVAAAAYWYIPSTMGFFKALPDSAVERWEA